MPVNDTVSLPYNVGLLWSDIVPVFSDYVRKATNFGSSLEDDLLYAFVSTARRSFDI